METQNKFHPFYNLKNWWCTIVKHFFTHFWPQIVQRAIVLVHSHLPMLLMYICPKWVPRKDFEGRPQPRTQFNLGFGVQSSACTDSFSPRKEEKTKQLSNKVTTHDEDPKGWLRRLIFLVDKRFFYIQGNLGQTRFGKGSFACKNYSSILEGNWVGLQEV